MARKKTPAKQEVQEVTKSTPAATDKKTAEQAAGSASKQLLKKTAEFYGIPEEEATLEMAFNMMYSQDIDQTAEKITKGQSRERAKQAADKIITAAKEITGKNDLTWAELSEICREKTAPLNEKLEAIRNDPTLKRSVETTTKAVNQLEIFIKSEEFKKLQRGIESIRTTIKENREYFAEIGKRAKELNDLIPFIQIVIKENYPGGITVDDVLEQCSISGEPETDIARDILDKARQRATSYDEGTQTIEAVAETIADLPRIKRDLPVYLTTFRSRPTDIFPFWDKKQASIDDRANTAFIEKFDTKLFIENYAEIVANLSVSTDKLLKYALYEFTRNNSKKTSINCSIVFDLRDFAYHQGYDVYPHDNSDREKKRANKTLDKVRDRVNKDLDILFSLSVSWKSKDNRTKDPHDFNRVRLVTERGQIKNGIVYFSFAPPFAQLLVNRNIQGQYPAKLLLMDNRKATAYKLGNKLFEHFYMDNNVIQGTNDILQVKTILPYTGLATFEEVQQKDRGHWVERIKEPLENALDELTQTELLGDWEYTKAKKEPLTDAEAAGICDDYFYFEALYIHFTPYDELDQHERIEKKKQQIEKAQKRKERRKQAAIKKNIKRKSDKERGEEGES